MEDDDRVRILVEFLCAKKVEDSGGIIARNPSIPTCLLTDDFSKRLSNVVCFRKLIVLQRWHSFFDDCYKKMLSSHEVYLTLVLFACISEHKCNQNICESFINVCILVNLLNDETLEKTGVNFRHLNLDIIMVFYQNVLKFLFCKPGGFWRLVEYIRSYRLVKKQCNKNYLLPEGSTDAVNDRDEDIEKFRGELFGIVRLTINPDEAANDERSIYLANLVLSIPSVELPSLPSYTDLIKRQVAFRKNEEPKIAGEKEKTEMAVKCEVLNVPLHGCTSSISDFNTNYDAKNQENTERYENIIQAVIRHNRSKSSSNEHTNNQIQEEVEGVLEHLKDTIKSLIEVLDEYDKE